MYLGIDLGTSEVKVLLLDAAGTIVSTAGEPLTDDDRARIEVSLGQLSSLAAARGEYGDPLRLALVAAGRPTGLLAISGAHITDRQREPLFLFADQAALAVERAQLREQALRAELTDEVERLASTLVAAVSHDLRTPLASIKAASSILADPLLAADVDPDARQELMTSIDAQADRLAVMVANLLDMGRIQAGVLQPRTALIAVEDLIHAALGSLAATYPSSAPTVELVEPLPLVEADAVLISRVLANLLDNAYRHTPKNTPVRVTARLTDPRTVTVSVTDHGPGVNLNQRSEIFGLYVRRSRDSGTGLGLAIAKTFIDAHHQRIWVENAPAGGATFSFTLAAASHVAPTPASPADGGPLIESPSVDDTQIGGAVMDATRSAACPLS